MTIAFTLSEFIEWNLAKYIHRKVKPQRHRRAILRPNLAYFFSSQTKTTIRISATCPKEIKKEVLVSEGINTFIPVFLFLFHSSTHLFYESIYVFSAFMLSFGCSCLCGTSFSTFSTFSTVCCVVIDDGRFVIFVIFVIFVYLFVILSSQKSNT